MRATSDALPTVLPQRNQGIVAADGTYEIVGLGPGDYLVSILGPGTRYWPAASDPAGATPVHVDLGRETSGIDGAVSIRTSVSAPETAAVTGTRPRVPVTVTARFGTAPVEGDVEVAVDGTAVARVALVRGTADVVLDSRPPGSYALTFRYLGSTVHDPSSTSRTLRVNPAVPVVVSSISPTHGRRGFGTEVVVRGSGFTVNSRVLFGTTAASEVTLVSPSELRVVTPWDHTRRTVPVVVEDGSTSATAPAAFSFTDVLGIRPVRLLDQHVWGRTPECADARALADVPDDASAVMLNVTAAEPVAAGYVIVFPGTDGRGTLAPGGSTVNFEPAAGWGSAPADVANSTIVPLPADGWVCAASSDAYTRVILDVTGYTLPSSGITSLTATRILDTRPGGAGTVQGPVQPRQRADVQVAGLAGVPHDATAVLLNVTVTGPPTAPGNLRVFPGGTAVPGTSVVNFAAGRDKASTTLVKLVDGKVSFWSDTDTPASVSPVHVVLDVVGYVGPSSVLAPVAPTRVLETRADGQRGPIAERLADGRVYSVPLAGVGPVPADATGVVLNVTAVQPTAPGNLRVYPDTHGDGSTAAPNASTLNYVVGRDIPNQVVVDLPPSGRVAFYSDSPGGLVDLAVDVVGIVRAP